MGINLKQKNNTKKAFTLVESLVAISILMIAIASPMTLAQKGLSTATLSKDQMIASFLAQDAIESVKNIRDQIAISKNTKYWLDDTVLKPCICTSEDECNPSSSLIFCTIDTTSAKWDNSSILKGDVNNPAKLNISYTAIPDSNGIKQFLKYDYTHDNCDTLNPCESKFTRYINIRKSDSNKDEAVVRVRVSWDSPQGVQNVDVKNFIYNLSTLDS